MIGKKTSVVDTKIKQVGIFDINTLYKEAKSWFDNRYFDFQEKEHTEKSYDIGDEYVFEWNASREVTEYVKFLINVRFFIRYLTKVTIKDKKLYKGDLEITVKADIELDYKNNWQTSKFKKFLFNFCNNYLIKNKVDFYYGKLKREGEEFISFIKPLLNLYNT